MTGDTVSYSMVLFDWKIQNVDTKYRRGFFCNSSSTDLDGIKRDGMTVFLKTGKFGKFQLWSTGKLSSITSCRIILTEKDIWANAQKRFLEND